MNEPGSLGQLQAKVGKGLHWGLLDIVSNKLIGISSAIIVTRQLMPEDFGLYSVASAFIGMAMMFTFTGFDSAIIQKGEVHKDDLNTAWSLELVKNLFLGIILYFSAPYMEIVMDMEGVTPIIRAVSWVFPIYGLRNIGLVLLRKELDMKRQFVFNALPQIVTAILTVFFAFTLRNVWALIYSYLVGASVSLILSYIIHPFRPVFKIDFERLKVLFRFGRWLFLSTIINFAKTQGVVLIIGRFWGVGTLGYYNRSAAFSLNIFAHLHKLFPKIVFPVFSKIQSDAKLLRESFLVTLKATTFLVSFIAGLGYALSAELVTLLLGERWLAAIPYLKIMFLLTLAEIMILPFHSLVTALGKPHLNTATGVLRVICVLIGALLGVYYDNIFILVYSILVADIVVVSSYTYVLPRVVRIKKSDIFINLLPAVAVCISIMVAGSSLDIIQSLSLWYSMFTKLGLLTLLSLLLFPISEQLLNLNFARFIRLLVPSSGLADKYVRLTRTLGVKGLDT